MLRVALTGGLGSGKSTAARIFAALGAHVIQADEIGQKMMEPGEALYSAIVEHFGSSIMRKDGTLDRSALAHIAFDDGRVEELNAIVHPAVIGYQERWARDIGAREPEAVCIVESALIFETRHRSAESARAPDSQQLPWRSRFDQIVLVTAPHDVKVQRFIERSLAVASKDREALASEAERRLALQIPDEEKIPLSNFVLRNDGTEAYLQLQVESVWRSLLKEAMKTTDH